MVERVTIAYDGAEHAFDLDHDHRRWTAVDPVGEKELDEGDYPLIAMSGAKRYALYSDHTFSLGESPYGQGSRRHALVCGRRHRLQGRRRRQRDARHRRRHRRDFGRRFQGDAWSRRNGRRDGARRRSPSPHRDRGRALRAHGHTDRPQSLRILDRARPRFRLRGPAHDGGSSARYGRGSTPEGAQGAALPESPFSAAA